MQSLELARFAAMMTKSADLKRRIATELGDQVLRAVDACETSLRQGGKLMFCGNGGSAADIGQSRKFDGASESVRGRGSSLCSATLQAGNCGTPKVPA